MRVHDFAHVHVHKVHVHESLNISYHTFTCIRSKIKSLKSFFMYVYSLCVLSCSMRVVVVPGNLSTGAPSDISNLTPQGNSTRYNLHLL